MLRMKAEREFERRDDQEDGRARCLVRLSGATELAAARVGLRGLAWLAAHLRLAGASQGDLEAALEGTLPAEEAE